MRIDNQLEGSQFDRNQLIALNANRAIDPNLLYRLPAMSKMEVEAVRTKDPKLNGKIAFSLANANEIAEREARGAAEVSGRIITCVESDYPAVLRDLELPPPVLYVRGTLPRDKTTAVAIVGSRRTDSYGREVARTFGRDLAAAGAWIASGLAAGVDGAAHRGAIEATGKTLAVFGCGIDVVYPKHHQALAAEVADHGAVVSQFPLGTPPHARNFPMRNHLIAIWAQLTLVIRATWKSGSLITARIALELGREVFAVPGSIFDSRSDGCHGLLADGAGVAHRPADLLPYLPGCSPVTCPPSQSHLQTSPSLLMVLPEVGQTVALEEVAQRAGQPVEALLAELAALELAGTIERLSGGRICRRSE